MASLGVATGHGADWGQKSQNNTEAYMLRYFGEPNDGQGNFQGSLAEHLFLNNAAQIRDLGRARKEQPRGRNYEIEGLLGNESRSPVPVDPESTAERCGETQSS